jgi:hypothetical protein
LRHSLPRGGASRIEATSVILQASASATTRCALGLDDEQASRVLVRPLADLAQRWQNRWPFWSRVFFHAFGGRFGDHRDWPVIDAWAEQIALTLHRLRSAPPP